MSIDIISHRGYWKVQEEKNTLQAFTRSFRQSFGVETDVRDMCGGLVISHDTPVDPVISLDEMLIEYIATNRKTPLALNIKADGLQKLLMHLLNKYSIEEYFVFDMSIPDTIGYLASGMNVFTRQSEYERSAAFYDKAKGVWLDAFLSEWYGESEITGHIMAGKKVCVVSPELHQRDHIAGWERLHSMSVKDSGMLMLCTDYPEEARAFFYE